MDPLPPIDDAFSLRLLAVSREAGALALSHFQPNARTRARVDWKPGGSPVTQADFAVDRFLRERLPALLPGAGWLSEETADTPERLGRRAVFVVDPIDGTRAFMEGDPRWAVSVALVVDGRPVAGVVEAPAAAETFQARLGAGAFLNGRRLTVLDRASLREGRLAGPKFLIDPVARRTGMAAQPKVPSLALRFARLAAGAFEAAIASTDSHDWDIAAADLVAQEAGLSLRAMDGCAPRYNRPDPTHGVLLATNPSLEPTLRDALRDVLEAAQSDRARA